MAMQVAATTWGPSGVLGAFVMTAGPGGAFKSAVFYLCGLMIAALAAYVITDFTLGDELVQNA
jgi:PTS system sucrose-specific IIC component